MAKHQGRGKHNANKLTPSDLDRLQALYESGVGSIDSLAAQFSIAPATVSYHARKKSWKARGIRKAAVLAAEIAEQGDAGGDVASMRSEALAREARGHVELVRQHKRTIRNALRRCEGLLARLEHMESMDWDTFQPHGILAANLAKAAGQLLSKVVPLERTTFGLTDKHGAGDQPSAFIVNFGFDRQRAGGGGANPVPTVTVREAKPANIIED